MGTVWTEAEDAYVVTVVAGGNEIQLTPRQVLDHVRGVLDASRRAAVDAAMVQRARESGSRAATTLANRVRREHPPLDHELTAPLVFEPVVTGTMSPYVRVLLHSATVARWTVAEADAYARTLMTTQRQADDETIYRRLLTERIQPSTAAKLIADLGGVIQEF